MMLEEAPREVMLDVEEDQRNVRSESFDAGTERPVMLKPRLPPFDNCLGGPTARRQNVRPAQLGEARRRSNLDSHGRNTSQRVATTTIPARPRETSSGRPRDKVLHLRAPPALSTRAHQGSGYGSSKSRALPWIVTPP